ncbi:hypothetical protein [Roseivirga misakiensis]|uniref:Uncharacterized protein n=1 Tax=Roseivirga misakiensis TaxID=1563681 RepID=A0A1E5SZI7_9BACT|nr:hypothetical protein [Roseivirga misakiensis]OEK04531.1 hypothetical protein BFP71_13775 [Roseivirga misakiensis]
MNEFLIKLKLAQNFRTELKVSKSEFLKAFKASVDPGSTSLNAGPFDIFKASKNDYVGRINDNNFKIKKRRRFFDGNLDLAVATGKFFEKNDHLVIEAEISSFRSMFIGYGILIILFYLVLLVSFPFSGDDSNENRFMFPFLILHGLFMLGVPYILMRNSTKRMIRDLEKDFYYMTKDLN